MFKKLIFFTSMFAIFLISCGESAEGIDVDKIKEVCECSDAYVRVIKDLNETLGSQSVEDAEDDPELREALSTKFTILKNIDNKCLKDLGFKMEEIEECNDGELKEIKSGKFMDNF